MNRIRLHNSSNKILKMRPVFCTLKRHAGESLPHPAHLTTASFVKKGTLMAAAQSTDSLPPLPIADGIDFRTVEYAPGYCVGSNGTVWSCRRPGPTKGFGNWKQLRPTNDVYGYATICLMIDGTSRKRKVHTLVLECFVGARPDGAVACHFPSSDKSNNSASNLMWGTISENEQHKLIHGTKTIGENNNKAKLSVSDVIEIRRRRAAGERCTDLAADFGVTSEQIGNITRRLQWKHIRDE